MQEFVELPRTHSPRRRSGFFLLMLAVLAVILLGGRTALSYYVDVLWFESLGYRDVFWKTLGLQWGIFVAFAAATFLVVYGSFLALKRAHLPNLPSGHTIFIGGQPLKLPVEPVLRVIALGLSLVVAVATGAGMMLEWPTIALYRYAPRIAGCFVDPIFGRPLNFFLFTLPAWQLFVGWLLTLAVMTCALSIFFIFMTGGTRAFAGRSRSYVALPWRGLSITFAVFLLVLAMRVYLGRFERLFDSHTIFSGVTYSDAHVLLPGTLVVCAALVLGAVIAAINAVRAPRGRWIAAAILPAALCYVCLQAADWYVSSFIVKPNELVREQPYIANNIALTRQAYGLDRVSQREFPAETDVAAADPAHNQATLQNIRLWDWHALQDTLRQIQEIRTYYDFPDIDIDRYQIDGVTRQVMLATRELNVEKLPESSRNWINEKLIYTHGYGITMNPVNGFTPEGLPTLILSNMPVQSTAHGLAVTRPEVYFGELTNTDVYVKTRQKEFNYPQGQTNNLTSYEGTGDIVLGDDGRLSWVMDAFTTSDSYPYSTHYRLGNELINYMRNSVKVVVDAYDGTTTFYVFDSGDPIIAGYRAVFPSLFKDASTMPAGLRKHVRYPEMLLKLQAEVYGLYHMTDPEAFYNREDLWTVATEVGLGEGGQQTTQAMEPNFVLMKLPGESGEEFVEILPFTPANRNNLIGWIAGRSDGAQYGKSAVYNFPKTKLVDGPLQIEARIDQNAQLSGQLTLWNQQGSHVRRGALLVIPSGRALLYAEPIYLQAERSPMPELRLVVLAVQDRLAYGPTFEAAMSALFGGAVSSTSAAAVPAEQAGRPASAASPQPAADLNALIAEAAKDLADYQRLTAEGKLGEAGQKLEELKRAIEKLNTRQR